MSLPRVYEAVQPESLLVRARLARRRRSWRRRPSIGLLLLVAASLAIAIPPAVEYFGQANPSFQFHGGTLYTASTSTLSHPYCGLVCPYQVLQSAGTVAFGTVTFTVYEIAGTPAIGPIIDGCVGGQAAAKVVERWGGTYTTCLCPPPAGASPGAASCASSWMSPDGLSGLEYLGNSQFTFLVRPSESIYGVPPPFGLVLFLIPVAVAVVAAGHMVHQRGASKHRGAPRGLPSARSSPDLPLDC